jgi:thiol-disulfide isomerase/thioredoxin
VTGRRRRFGGMGRTRAGARGAVLAGVPPSGALAACQSDPNSLAAQAGSGSRAGYAAGDGSIEQLAPASRRAARAAGHDRRRRAVVDGREQGAGKVVVVNVWGSWCPPCVAETPALQGAWAAYEKAASRSRSSGIDTMEPPQNGARVPQEGQGRDLPVDQRPGQPGCAPTLALQGKAPATPTTLVLDRQGRVAARVLGPITEVTLRSLVDAVLAEA